MNRLIMKQNTVDVFILTDRYIDWRVNIMTFQVEMWFDSGWMVSRAVIGVVGD